MKIGIISDSHDNGIAVENALKIFKEKGVELIIHLGDIISPFTAKKLFNLGVPVKAVFGNNDGEKKFMREIFQNFGGEIAEYTWVGEIDGIKIAFTHGHIHYLVESLIDSNKYDIVFSGHTHEKVEEKHEKTLHLNPGESGGWLKSEGNVIILETNPLNYKFVSFDPFNKIG